MKFPDVLREYQIRLLFDSFERDFSRHFVPPDLGKLFLLRPLSVEQSG